jgi:hypothetical protein
LCCSGCKGNEVSYRIQLTGQMKGSWFFVCFNCYEKLNPSYVERKIVVEDAKINFDFPKLLLKGV